MLFFQIFLLAAVWTLFLLYVRLLRTQLWDRLLVLAGVVGLAVFFVQPEWSTTVAKWLGIGRGVDFLFYLGHALAAFLLLFANARSVEQQRQIAGLTRALALATARPKPARKDEE